MDRRFKEVDNGEDLFPDADGSWRCCVADTGISVLATPMQHTMPCVGYCVEEPKVYVYVCVCVCVLYVCMYACIMYV
jgi:hypothetical protein